ncbi:flagellar basal body P-ring formation chaperone FlgA [Pseudoalteromonas sp. SMS1]|uniref:flagellar basal body P-ring formation chaperone FlgA n=1 Tax=Pseudoalteromonas sp. SMS1 TaxID=2908894 RepID=UPI001F35A155|nr:flagellar basal body P-ring formation chaperone FlgA [Pseudoalteromonas sp. SMS1]MCF2860216.1 flagellar basal body P-ring formation chaperone FlgA [Pseudoalteromonas sp. SMS1]
MKFAWISFITLMPLYVAAEPENIKLSQSLYQGNEYIALASILDLSKASSGAQKAISNLRMPWPAHQQYVSKSDITEYIVKNTSFQTGEITVSGWPRVILKHCYEVPLLDLSPLVQGVFKQQFDAHFATLKHIAWDRKAQKICTQTHSSIREFEIKATSDLWGRHKRFSVTRGQQQWWITAELTYSVNQAVAVRSIRANRDIHQDDLTWQWRDAESLVRTKQVKPESGLIAARAIKAGQAILASDFRKKPDVKKGTWVDLTYHYKGIKLEAKAKALKDGFVGDEIPVKLEKGNSALRVTVAAKEKVNAIKQ